MRTPQNKIERTSIGGSGGGESGKFLTSFAWDWMFMRSKRWNCGVLILLKGMRKYTLAVMTTITLCSTISSLPFWVTVWNRWTVLIAAAGALACKCPVHPTRMRANKIP